MADIGIYEPVEDLYFEDHLPGSVQVLGSVLVTEEEIIAFAKRYDPQVFHVDPEAAKATSFGGLVASGWHTVALAMRLIVDGRLSRVKNLGSSGVDEVRWLKPLRPGTQIRVRATVLESRPSKSRPEMGLTKFRYEVLDETGNCLTDMVTTAMLGRREPGARP